MSVECSFQEIPYVSKLKSVISKIISLPTTPTVWIPDVLWNLPSTVIPAPPKKLFDIFPSMQYDDAKNEVEAESLDSENGSARGDDSDGERESERDDDFEGSESYSENSLSDDDADPFADLSEDSNTEFEDGSDDEAARETVK
ncbi:hypothetical protein PsorP6_016365 [Peronosclerospora sorghi]|uniref:Uncharacterized protein n=1 Tax=Peronosclerospora sorghi TaxID=230839 RepID=A0ACC0VMU5_9STRA|nr:hypothetical protein PsorP6_016365 [Peronosclerospora sorghi]